MKFIHSPPQSSYKKLFIGTNIGDALLIDMSENKALPKVLRDEEVERGKIRRPPIPYIPPEDPILESAEKKSGSKVSRSRYQMEQLSSIKYTILAQTKLL